MYSVTQCAAAKLSEWARLGCIYGAASVLIHKAMVRWDHLNMSLQTVCGNLEKGLLACVHGAMGHHGVASYVASMKPTELPTARSQLLRGCCKVNFSRGHPVAHDIVEVCTSSGLSDTTEMRWNDYEQYKMAILQPLSDEHATLGIVLHR